MLERALKLAKETEETQARLISGEGFRRQLSDIKSMVDALATRSAEPTSTAIIATLQQAVVSILLKIDARDDIAVMLPAITDAPEHSHPAASSKLTSLSSRQNDVLRLMADGLPNRLIGQKLGISEGTAKLHVAAILKKLGARNRTEAVLMHGGGPDLKASILKASIQRLGTGPPSIQSCTLLTVRFRPRPRRESHKLHLRLFRSLGARCELPDDIAGPTD